ncbi:MAG: LCP family protein [Actinomycetota bacterium]|nr:LCP family protein [Actinomycetota bacterium]
MPGAGQLWVGRWHRGVVLVAVWAALVVSVLALPVRDVVGIPSLLARPGVLDAVLVGNVVVLAFRAYAIIDAFRCARRPLRMPVPLLPATAGEHVVVRAAGVALAVVNVLPHAAVAHYGLEARAVLTDVFPVAAEPAHAAEPVGADGPESTGRAEPSSLMGRDRFSILLLGSDAGPLRRSLRTDSIMVATIEPSSGRAGLISVPRNLVRVPLPGWVRAPWRCGCFPGPINGLFDYFRDRDDLVPDGVDDPGMAVLIGAVEELLQLPIDRYAMVDLRGFVDVVDALGGVTVHVDRRIYDQLDSPHEGEWDAIDLRPGRHHLDGRQALVYVRTRRGSDDYGRMHRQRCFLGALLEQADAPTVLRRFARLAAIARASITTDLPRDVLSDVVDLAVMVDPADVRLLSVTPPDFVAGRDRDGYPIPDVALVRTAVRSLLDAEPAPAAPAPVVQSATTRETPTTTPPPTTEPLSRACR